jgi:hypothetical protein
MNTILQTLRTKLAADTLAFLEAGGMIKDGLSPSIIDAEIARVRACASTTDSQKRKRVAILEAKR